MIKNHAENREDRKERDKTHMARKEAIKRRETGKEEERRRNASKLVVISVRKRDWPGSCGQHAEDDRRQKIPQSWRQSKLM